MEWSVVCEQTMAQLAPIVMDAAVCERLFHLLDLTCLKAGDTVASITALCEKARGSYGHVAGVCVLPAFVRLVANQLAATPIKTVTVANFPEGIKALDYVLIDINRSVQKGAQEIDVVFPYRRYLAGERQYARSFVAACKAACGDNILLKVILETGALKELSLIASASFDTLTAGADFIKTSTGHMAGATLETVIPLLFVLRDLTPKLKRPLGLKISGGIKTLEQAVSYIALSELVMGRAWVVPETFRIGASQLVDEIAKF